jgi:hypothetical protein
VPGVIATGTNIGGALLRTLNETNQRLWPELTKVR